jgi:peptidyl-tRNA hydrolase, PTH1 family
MVTGSEGSPGLKLVKVVVGLGNPGPQYHGTRHNVGFMVLDKIAERLGLTWQRSGNAEWANVGGEMNRLVGGGLAIDAGHDGSSDGITGPGATPLDLVLCKPQTFMNNSGEIVAVLKKQGIKPEEMLIVHDELEKPLGYVGIRFGGSARGHNGLRSIMARCGDGVEFWRVRLGIGRPDGAVDVGDYVLGKFAKVEQSIIDGAVIKAAGLIVQT